jgi:hypothetical protein
MAEVERQTLDGYQTYRKEEVDKLVELYISGASRDTPDPILDACVAVYRLGGPLIGDRQ